MKKYPVLFLVFFVALLPVYPNPNEPSPAPRAFPAGLRDFFPGRLCLADKLLTMAQADRKDMPPPSFELKPAILFTNNSDKTVRAYMQDNQLSPSGTPAGDYVIGSGWTVMITSGIEPGMNVKSINFESLTWSSRVYVDEDRVMSNGHVYRIVLAGNQTGGYTTTVTEEASEDFFE
jgi:hypothetical protein